MIIQNMSETDIDFAVQCVSTEGWLSETRDTFENFLKYDRKGCFVGKIGEQRIGICIATKYYLNGFIGELIVLKEFRSKGYGRQLFLEAIKYLKSNNIKYIYLDADLNAVPIYERHGFRKITRSLRFIGSFSGINHREIRCMDLKEIGKICSIDFVLFGDDRSFFLKRIFEKYPDYCLVLEKNGKICGYLFGRPGNGVLTIGPIVVLNSKANPLMLLEKLSHIVADVPFRFGVLENNLWASELCRTSKSLLEQEYCWRMNLGDRSKLNNDNKLFCIGSAAKG